MANIKVIKTDSLPKCPHCEQELDTIEKVEHGQLETHVVYICPKCKKILSIGYNTLN